MKSMLGAAAAAGLIAAALAGGEPTYGMPENTEPASYSIIVNGVETGCRIRNVASGKASGRTECLDGNSILASASLRRDEDDLVLADAGGRTIARFSVADGAAWESYAPAYPIYTMTRYGASPSGRQ